jgi:hypothetical protein
VKLSLDVILIDREIQPRAAIDPGLCADYAEALAAGAVFPPVDVFHDGTGYWLADGFHRVLAARLVKRPAVEAAVHRGTRREAILFAAGANAAHGLRRTNEDKRKAALTLLRDEEWGQWSDSKIAQKCCVSQPFVSQMRASLITVISEEPPAARTYTTKHGTVATMRTANIGRGRARTAASLGLAPKPKPPVTGGTIFRDGKEVEVATNEEVEQYQHRLFQVIDAVEALDTAPPPPEYLSMLPDAMDYYFDEHLDGARRWLAEFDHAWRRKRPAGPARLTASYATAAE